MSGPKVLLLDIETAPDLADVWALFKQNIGLNQIRENGYIMMWGAKWLGSEEVIYDSCREGGKADERVMLKNLNKLLKEADLVVGHNSDRFDLPWIRAQMAIHGLKPFAPVKQQDTLKMAKKLFRFRSNRLEYIAKALQCTPKLKHNKYPGHELWTECLKGNQDAWDEMIEYCCQDVMTLEEVYMKLRPWNRAGFNAGLYYDTEEPQCPSCGGTHLVRRGYAYTGVSKFQRFRCKDCGHWSRGRTNVLTKDKRKSLLAHVSA